MVKKVRYQENRSPRHRRTSPRDHFVFEPFDTALIAAAIAAVFWLEWLAHSPPV